MRCNIRYEIRYEMRCNIRYGIRYNMRYNMRCNIRYEIRYNMRYNDVRINYTLILEACKYIEGCSRCVSSRGIQATAEEHLTPSINKHSLGSITKTEER